MAYLKSMEDLYTRLDQVGFDATFVRARVLPEWWKDSLASVPSNRALAEAAISRVLGIPVSALRNHKAKLALPDPGAVRLKRRRGTATKDLRTSIHLARQVTRALVKELPSLQPFGGLKTPKQLRSVILSTREYVDLEALLEVAWAEGVAVFHLSSLPRTAKKFSGIASFCDSVPVIVLASGRDSSPWLAFHLAHELGHVFLGHVVPGSDPLADADIDTRDADDQEVTADEFACELLTGAPRLTASPIPGLTAPKLAEQARALGSRDKIDPGVIALIYGRNAGRMPVAQSAIKLMGMDRGAHEKITRALKSRLPDELPEAPARCLSLVIAA